MNRRIVCWIASGLVALFASSASHAALLSRLGGAAYYDDVLNITWLADANLATTTTFGLFSAAGDGSMDWTTANNYIAAMNAANYLGTNTWRLPTLSPINGTAFDYTYSPSGTTDVGFNITSTASELSYMFYVDLANTGYFDTAGSATGCATATPYCLTNTGPFSNLQPGNYWDGLAFAKPGTSGAAWIFEMYQGAQSEDLQYGTDFVWPVAPGDVFATALPEPSAIWLFGLGAGSLLGFDRRRSRRRPATS